jgi:RHS repeat-associated protein
LTTDNTGNVVARQLYDAWGNIRASASSGTMPTDIGYTGQRLDISTGLMYYRARYYASSLGRFMSADTIVPSASDPQQLNRYAYARGNPVRYTDPTGHYIFEDDPNEGLVYDADRVQRHFGVKVRLRESDESWVRDTGHHPTDAEFIGAMFSRPLMALIAVLAPEATVGAGSLLCSNGARCVTGAVNSATNFFGSLAGQRVTGKIDFLDAMTAAGAGFFSGYVMPTSPGQAALTYGLAGGAQQIASDVLHGRDVSPGLVLLNSGLSAGFGSRFGVYTPDKQLLQASVSEIWKAGQGSTTAAASITFKNLVNAWRYVPNTITFGNFMRSMITSAASNGIPNLLVNLTQ